MIDIIIDDKMNMPNSLPRFLLMLMVVFFTGSSAMASPPSVLLDWNFAAEESDKPVTDGQRIGPGGLGVHRDVHLKDDSGNRLQGTAVHQPSYAVFPKSELDRPEVDGKALRTGVGAEGKGNLASLDDITQRNSDFSVWTRVKFLGEGADGDDMVLGRPNRWFLKRQKNTHGLAISFPGLPSEEINGGKTVLENNVWHDVGLSFDGDAGDNIPDLIKIYVDGKLVDVVEGSATFDRGDYFHVGAGGMNSLATDALFDRVLYWDGIADEVAYANLSGVPQSEIVRQDDSRIVQLRLLRKLAEIGNPFSKSAIEQTTLFQQLKKNGLSTDAESYLSQLQKFEILGDSLLADAKAGKTDAEAHLFELVKQRDQFFAKQVDGLGPMVCFTRYPLSAPNAASCAIWQSVPERWGCSIRIYDPHQPSLGPQTIFEDLEGSIYDMNLSYDAKTLFFSYRKKDEPCWQIYEIGVDGNGFKKISRDPSFHEIAATELPDGRLIFVSTRCKGFTVCQPGPRSNLHVMNRDGTGVQCVSQNTLSDFSPQVLPDGRVLFTRWEYIDRDLTYRQGLWTQNPDGTGYQLFFGNTIRDSGVFWQSRPVPGQGNLLVSTFAPHHGWSHGAIGLIDNRMGIESPRGKGFVYLTPEIPTIFDQSFRWSYRDPFPVNDYQFLVAYGGGVSGTGPFALYLLDLCGNKTLVYRDPSMGYYSPILLRPTKVPPVVMSQERNPDVQKGEEWGTVFLADVYEGLTGIERGRVKYIQVMEQMPKLSDLVNRAYDQYPLMSYGTYYAKKCWGRVPVQADGSACFKIPALREVYFQVLDEEGRELQRMTSALQLMPDEKRSCIGCHEHRSMTPLSEVSSHPLALHQSVKELEPPAWDNDGIVDYVKIVQPVWDKYCVECHSGLDPDGGYDLSGDKTRLFNMSYDNLLGRSQSYRQHDMQTGEMLPEEAAKGKPLVHFFWLLKTPTAVNQPLQTGSHASRLIDYLDAKHCGQEIPLEDRQRIYMWIDANVPYYATYEKSRRLSPGGRDLCTDVATGQNSAWFAGPFTEVYDRRCASCHGPYPHPNDIQRIWDGMFTWINFTHPELSPALTAHLSKEAGGRGLGTEKDGQGSLLFKDTKDPDFVKMLKAIREGHQEMLRHPRVDGT